MRDFAVALPFEEVRSTHQDTLLGNLWHLANPMLSVAVYYLVFGVMLDVSRGIDNYILFLMVGVFAFGLTTRCVLGGATAISANQGLMRSIRFPRALLPFSVIMSQAVHVRLRARRARRGRPGHRRGSRRCAGSLLPAIVVLHTCLNLGGAFIAARLNDSFRDVQQIIPFLFRLLAYVSGVMFPLEQFLTETGRQLLPTLIRLNPLIGIIDMYRYVFMGMPVFDGDLVRASSGRAPLWCSGSRLPGAEWRYGR